jgi:outer membrane lipoprotein LolB
VSGALRRRSALGRAAVVTWLIGLAGCATPVPPGEPLALTAAGRLSVRIEAHAGRPAQSLAAAFEWRGSGDRGELTLLSALGTQIAKARWVPGAAWLTSPDGEARFETLDELAERALGERVPLAAWPDWLAGRPWPRAPVTPAPLTTSATSAGATFEQLGWRVDLTRHADGRIEARRAAPPVVTVRIVLDAGAREGGMP